MEVWICLLVFGAGIFFGRTTFADKTGKQKQKEKIKVDKADELFNQLQQDVDSGKLDEYRATEYIYKWRMFLHKD